MKIYLTITIFLLVSGTFVNGSDFQQDFNRSGFYAAMASESLDTVNAAIDVASKSTLANKDAFVGTLMMKKAGLVPNPGNKLNLFKSGHKKLERAITKENNNAELRFLRLMIQEHAPGILGYKKQIDEDNKLIHSAYKSLSPVVQKAIADYSKKSNSSKTRIFIMGSSTNKKVLAIYYTQTGQLGDIVDNFTAPFIAAGIQVEKVIVTPKTAYPFPWTSASFFAEMPESVLSIPTELNPFTLKETAYDLIIFAYQPWFLSPSIPANSILMSPAFQSILKNTPVVTLIGARNMWLNAHVRLRKNFKQLGANLVGVVALIDRNNNTISAVTILYWMLTGKKDRYLNMFPRPGVADADVLNAGESGKIVLEYLISGNWAGLQPKLVASKSVEVHSDLMFIEARAKILFSIWASLIIKKKNRKPWVFLSKYYLLIALFIVAPIVVFINKLLFQPFLRKQINQKKQFYLALN